VDGTVGIKRGMKFLNNINEEILRDRYISNQFVVFKAGWIAENACRKLVKETDEALARSCFRRDYTLNQHPRRMDVVSGSLLRCSDLFPTINAFARSPEILKFVRYITCNEGLKPGQHDPLSPAHINRFIGIGSQHGWHLDDAGYKLVLITKWCANNDETGGGVRLIPNFVSKQDRHKSLKARLSSPGEHAEVITDDDDDDDACTLFEKRIPKARIKELKFCSLEGYLMEGRAVLHTVVPQTQDDTVRISVCFSFDDIHDESNYETSATSLYGDKTKTT